jgi:NB-ARC domain
MGCPRRGRLTLCPVAQNNPTTQPLTGSAGRPSPGVQGSNSAEGQRGTILRPAHRWRRLCRDERACSRVRGGIFTGNFRAIPVRQLMPNTVWSAATYARPNTDPIKPGPKGLRPVAGNPGRCPCDIACPYLVWQSYNTLMLTPEFWTVVGSSAGVVAAILAAVQVWQARRRRIAYNSTEEMLLDDGPGSPPGGSFPPFGRLGAHVVGRHDIVTKLENIVATSDGFVHVLCGLGGIGKSTIALEVARRCRERNYTVWWLSCTSATMVTRAMLEIGQEYLGISEDERREALSGRRNAADLVWRRLESAPNWLLIFDNVDDPTILSYGDGAVKEGKGWLRASRKGAVMVTSRLREADAWGSRAHIYEVKLLSSDEGADILLSLAPGAGTAAEARELSQRLANFPLALYQAGSHISSEFVGERTFNSYREALATNFAALLGSVAAHKNEDEMRSEVTAVWELSVRRLERNGYAGTREMPELLS